MRHFLIGLSLLIAVSPLLPAPARNDGKADQSQQVLLVSAKSGDVEIYVLNVDTKEMKQLTNSPGEDSYPAWSPNGKQIAFASNRDGMTNIYVMDSDGKNVKQLTKGAEKSRGPAWSPDGKKIAFSRMILDPVNMVQSCAIMVMDPDGGDVKQIGEDDAWNPAYSPDGKKILFASKRDGDGFRIYEMEADGTNIKKLTDNPNPYGSVYPCYSPDGKKIMWTDGDEDGLELHIADADGKNAKALTKDGGMNTFASWSPDGKSIVYQHLPDMKAGHVYIMDADGTNRRELLKDEPLIKGARSAWRPK